MSSLRKLTLTSLFSALAVVFLYMASMLPSARLAFVALAGLFIVAEVISVDTRHAFTGYVVSSIIALFLIPLKIIAVLYLCFLGIYPLLKNLVEKIRNVYLEWSLKILIFNTLLGILYSITIKFLQLSLEGLEISKWIMWLGLNIVFIVYDYGISKLIMFYINAVAPKLKLRN